MLRSALKYSLFFIVTLIVVTNSSFAQQTDSQLANHYYNNGELDKAKGYYEKLYKNDPNKRFFDRLYACYMAEKDFKSAEKLIKQQMSYSKNDVMYQVLLGQFFEETNNQSKADKVYKSVVDNVTANPHVVINIYNLFKAAGKNELAFQVISKGRSLLKDSYPLHFQFAEYYGSINDTKKMMQEYLNLIDYNAQYKSSVQTLLGRMIDFSDKNSNVYTVVKSELLAKVQSKPDDLTATELLTWFFIQSRDFQTALIQEQAIDKRLELRGRRVYELGLICTENNDYSTARKAFTYVKNLGDVSPYYHDAENSLLNTRYKEIVTNRNVEDSEIQETIKQYKETLNRIGYTNKSLPLVLELAHIEAFYSDQAKEAINLLTSSLQIPRLTDIQKAEIKMKLGDVHVLHGDIWEASLYYMQVDKDFKFEPIGQEARFKNARIFYYDGEFNYAQSQLDVLKQGTSKLISNDAIQLSLLITDNFGLDSNFQAMYWFAQADLLIEQHKYNQAFQLFDSIIQVYPYHSLGDEILLKKSQAMQQQGKWNDAIAYLDELLKYHGKDILADDAWFQKGEIYQNHLMDNEKAMECYKEIIFNFKGSLHVIEARKRYRELRGDKVVEEEI
ncbi:MAG TPA: tetratricopeptide repeat protein [Taishania sp.]|nr:tetratricopeptide repeat protein [Taishania sp.]